MVFVSVKQSLGFTAAICAPPKRTSALIAEGAAEAVRRFRAGRLEVREPDLPATLEIELYRREMAQKASTLREVERTGERTVTVTADTMVKAAELAWGAIARSLDEPSPWLS